MKYFSAFHFLYALAVLETMAICMTVLVNVAGGEVLPDTDSSHGDNEEVCASTFNIDAWQTGKRRSYELSDDLQKMSQSRDYLESLQGTCFAEYWDSIPDLVVDANDTTRTMRVVGNSFLGRMAVYKFLILEQTDYFLDHSTSVNSSNKALPLYHWLWAYGAQLDWQHRSGRLSVGSSNGNAADVDIIQVEDTISTTSWWGFMNYGFSVAVLLGFIEAQQQSQGASEVPYYVVQLDPDSQTLMEEEKEAMEGTVKAWQDLFENGYQNYVNHFQQQQDSDFDAETIQQWRFELQKAVWDAHTQVIEHGVGANRSKELLGILPQDEQQFGAGWANMVDILAATCLPTDLVSLVEDGAGFLPEAVVTEERMKEWKSSTGNKLQQRRARTVQNCQQLADKSVAGMAAFWRRVVRNSPGVSRDMPETVFRLFHGTVLAKTKELFRVLYLYAKPW